LLPPSVPAGHAANPVPVGNCSTFTPGTYSGAGSVALTARNYFASGVYYFDNVGTMDLTGKSLFGGNSASNETTVTATSDARPCSNDLAVPGTVGSGVKFILGGTSAVVTGNNGFIELFARQGGASSTEGRQGVTLMTVPPSTANWDPSPIDYATARAGEASCGGGGSNIGFVVHGYTITPYSRVCIRNNQDQTQYLSGLDVGRLTVDDSNNIGGLTISVTQQSSPRTLRVTATATDATGATARPITATATVTIDNSTNAFNVTSWRVD
jgi:hypothetical protein